MATWMVTNSAVWLKADGDAAEKLHLIGSIIKFSGGWGSSLTPMDREAARVKEQALAAREPSVRKHLERDQARGRAVLSPSLKRKLEAAEAAMEKETAQ